MFIDEGKPIEYVSALFSTSLMPDKLNQSTELKKIEKSFQKSNVPKAQPKPVKQAPKHKNDAENELVIPKTMLFIPKYIQIDFYVYNNS